jgi:hypothetical protein
MRSSLLTLLAISLATATLGVPSIAVAQCTGDEARPNVVGIWEWVHTDGGFAYQIITPDSIGYTVQLEFSETDLREYRGLDYCSWCGFGLSTPAVRLPDRVLLRGYT